MPATDEGRQFGRALEIQLRGRSQKEFAEAVAREEGRDRPYSQQQVSTWISGIEPNPRQAIAIERALRVRAGTLTQLLGYLPVSSKPVKTVREAIEADPGLDETGRAAVLSTYRSLVQQPRRPGRQSRP